MTKDQVPPHGLTRLETTGFILLAWAGVAFGVALFGLGVIGLIQSGKGQSVVVAIAGLVIGGLAWRNVALARAARRPRQQLFGPDESLR